MPVSFNNIPSNLRVPLAYIEFDNTRAVVGTPNIPHKMLVVGQRLAAGTVNANVPTLITNSAQAENAFGRGSMLASMFASIKKANRYTETWAIALDENAAGNAATGTITATGSATASGTLNLYIAGERVQVKITAGDLQTAIATNIAVAINANTMLPVTAAVNGVTTNQVDITARWKGETGNDIDLRTNYYQGEVTPAGSVIAIVAMASGTGNPDIATAIAAMGNEWYNSIVMPYTDTANLVALETELNDRWGPLRMLEGVAFAAYRGTLSASSTFGNTRNSQLFTCVGSGIAPQPPYIWAAVNAAVAAASLSIDPARPLQTLPLIGIMPVSLATRWTQDERNILLFDGIATTMVDAGGRVLIERQITMYQKNSFNIADPSYLDVNTPYTLSYIRFATRARITQKFPRHKLADNGTKFGPGQAIVTPNIIRAELIALFRELEFKGIVENFDQYKADLIVERNVDDRNRIDVLSPPDLVNQFRIFAEQIQFIV